MIVINKLLTEVINYVKKRLRKSCEYVKKKRNKINKINNKDDSKGY